MRLYDEEEMKRKNEKNTKAMHYVLIGIILTIILIILLMGTIYYLIKNPNKIVVEVNGNVDTTLNTILSFEKSEDGSTMVYAPIRDMATYFNYKSYDGDPTKNLESRDRCYVDTTEDERIIFTLDSNIIYRKYNSTNSSDYEAITIDKPVIMKNEKLYIDIAGMAKAFNMNVQPFNEKTKKLEIYTLDKLATMAQTIAEKSGYVGIDEAFINKKAILDNMIVVVSKDDKKGVINFSTGKDVLNPKYTDITYMPEKKYFLVQIENGKVGVIGSNRETKIKAEYDELTLIDSEKELYLAKKETGYGIIGIIDGDGKDKTYIYPEYDQIGIDLSQFTVNGVKSQYILLGNLIPVLQNEKWKFFSIQNSDGSVNCNLINVEFDSIGCVTTTPRGVESKLLYIEGYDVIIVKRNDYYGCMNTEGIAAISPIYTDMYMETISGQTNYYMIDREGKTLSITEELEKKGYTKK